MLALVALVLMCWSLLDPRPLSIVVALSVGQATGTLSLVVFLVVVARDWRRAQRGETLSTSESNRPLAERTVADGPVSLKK
jgi:hypothetical protein